MAKFIVGSASDGIYEALHAAGVFADDPKSVSRVVIDLKCGEAARIYIDKYGDTLLTEVIRAGSVSIVERDEGLEPIKTEAAA